MSTSPLNLVRAVAVRQVKERLRYRFDLVALIGVTYVIFLLILLGARTVSGGSGPGGFGGDDAAGLAVGFVVVTLATLMYGFVSQGLREEADRGTLEQVAMSPYGLATVLVASTAVAAVFQVVEAAILLVAASLTAGVALELQPAGLVAALPALLALLVGVQGLGLVVGGVALVAKRVQALAGLLPLGFVVLVAAPVDDVPVLRLLPVAAPAQVLQDVLVRAEPLPVVDVLVALAVGAAWFALGLLVFGVCERLARDRALLGQY